MSVKVGNIEREKLRAGVTRVIALFISNVDGKTRYTGKCEIGAVLVFFKAEGK